MSFSPDEIGIIFTALLAVAVDLRETIEAVRRAGRTPDLELMKAHLTIQALLVRIQDKANAELAAA